MVALVIAALGHRLHARGAAEPSIADHSTALIEHYERQVDRLANSSFSPPALGLSEFQWLQITTFRSSQMDVTAPDFWH